MSTIVVHRATGHRYILVGTGYGATETAAPNALFGDLKLDIVTKFYGVVALCDASGNIAWSDSREFIVSEIDGESPAQILNRPPVGPR
jgi:hypothetical protein